MVEFTVTGEELWSKMERAVERVNERLRATVRIVEETQIPYAIVGGHAVRAWVAQVDETAVRTTLDVDIMIWPRDFPTLLAVMSKAGYIHRNTLGVDMFVERADAPARDAIHVIYAGQMVRNDDFEPNPGLESRCRAGGFCTVTLETLVRMKLNSYRRKDQVHLLDMLAVGLIDASWVDRFPPELRVRLQQLIDDPNG